MEYTINHSYRSTRDGQTYGPWVAGDKVELSDADAEWLERDSPGVIATPEPEPAERQAKSAPNRQQRATRNRAG